MSHLHFPRLRAVRDLARRYAAVFRHAWRERKERDAPYRLSHEAEFLPATLALQDTPVSPAPRVAMWLLMGFAFCTLIWAVFGHIDIVATATGKLLPNDRTKTVQPMETAVVRGIYVSDGQHVKPGDVLVELDDTQALADVMRLASDLTAARLQSARASALLAGLTPGATPRIAPIEGISRERLAREQNLLEGQYDELRAKLTQLDADIAKRDAELRSTREIVKKLEQTAPIARQRAEDLKGLVGRNFVARHGYLEQERVRIEQEADLATERSRINELQAALQEAKQQKSTLSAETRRIALDSLSDGEEKAAGYEQELLKAQVRAKLLKLTAPVEGTVQQLAVHTVGGVVTPAQPLMVIVPQDYPLEIEAYLENKDIGFVHPGQEAEIKIETFPYTKYGTIHGQITQVSGDAINDEKRGLIYSSRVQPEHSTMRVEDKTVNLAPGMAVTVEIKTGKRRVIEYFLSPLIQQVGESLHER